LNSIFSVFLLAYTSHVPNVVPLAMALQSVSASLPWLEKSHSYTALRSAIFGGILPKNRRDCWDFFLEK